MESAAVTNERETAGSPRRQAILDAAKQVFFEEGYATASMDRIAARAGVTKRTVYAHFENKHALFAAVVAQACANVVSQLPTPESLPDDPREGLAIALHRSRELMQSANCIRLERIIAAETERHPAFAATLSAAFAAGEAMLAQSLIRWGAAGRLKPLDAAVVARMLNDQVGCATSFRGLLGEPRDEALGRAAVDEAIRLFLIGYGI
ncbi:MAG: transcriptional regulator [Phenylobacterium sp.]|nr:transcriptional regulator [Phenylobacterium sp.]